MWTGMQTGLENKAWLTDQEFRKKFKEARWSRPPLNESSKWASTSTQVSNILEGHQNSTEKIAEKTWKTHVVLGSARLYVRVSTTEANAFDIKNESFRIELVYLSADDKVGMRFPIKEWFSVVRIYFYNPATNSFLGEAIGWLNKKEYAKGRIDIPHSVPIKKDSTGKITLEYGINPDNSRYICRGRITL